MVDATLFQRGSSIFLFANRKDVGSNALYLWSARNLAERFAVHPDSPIRIAPSGARMGGALFEAGGRLVRFGQDFTGQYGDGLFVFEIEELTPSVYRERAIGKIAFGDRKGPHTINFRDREILFDGTQSASRSLLRRGGWRHGDRAWKCPLPRASVHRCAASPAS